MGGGGLTEKKPREIMYVSRSASEMILNIRRKFRIAVDRKPQNHIIVVKFSAVLRLIYFRFCEMSFRILAVWYEISISSVWHRLVSFALLSSHPAPCLFYFRPNSFLNFLCYKNLFLFGVASEIENNFWFKRNQSPSSNLHARAFSNHLS